MPDSTLQEVSIRLAKLVERSYEQHEAMKERMDLAERRIEAIEKATEAATEGNKLMRKFIFGNGSSGLAEKVHVQTRFTGTLIKLLWIAATVGTAAAIAGLISLAKSILTP